MMMYLQLKIYLDHNLMIAQKNLHKIFSMEFQSVEIFPINSTDDGWREYEKPHNKKSRARSQSSNPPFIYVQFILITNMPHVKMMDIKMCEIVH